jgi:voltage-gated sodium channel
VDSSWYSAGPVRSASDDPASAGRGSTRAEEGLEMVAVCKQIAAADWFQRFITLVIVCAGVLVGVETYPGIAARHHDLLHVLDLVVLWIFFAEVSVKMIAEGKHFYRYFRDPWNVFDFLVVAASFSVMFLKQSESLEHGIVVLRLVRLLRVLRLVRALPKLQLLVAALLKSIPSMGYVSVLLFLLFYVYGVAAVFLFGHNDPIHFGNLQISLLSLFRTVTLEDWTDLMYIQMHGCAGYGYDGNPGLCTQSTAQPIVAPLFFVSFVLLGTMIILNLFIGVIMNGMNEAQAEAAQEEREAKKAHHDYVPALADDLEAIERQLAALQAAVVTARQRSQRESLPTTKSGITGMQLPADQFAE